MRYDIYSQHGRLLDTTACPDDARRKLADWPQAAFVIECGPAGQRIACVKDESPAAIEQENQDQADTLVAALADIR